MAYFYRYLYKAGNIKKVQADYLKQCVDEGRLPFTYYVVAISLPTQEKVTIYPAFEWNSQRVDKDHSQVIGIARGYTGAKYLIQQLVNDCYCLHKNVDILSYLKAMDPDIFQKEEA